MTRIVLQSKVGPDGVLQLNVPVGAMEANREVRVTIEAEAGPLSQAEWRQWVETMAGSIADPSFRRHEQGEYEPREELP